MQKSQKMNFEHLVKLIQKTDKAFRHHAIRSVDQTLVVRNWILGWYLVEYEQHGKDRARYGTELVQKLAHRLTAEGGRGFSYRSLALFKKFYLSYQDIVQAPPAQSSGGQLLDWPIVQALPAQLKRTVPDSLPPYARQLMVHFPLGWTHYAFLMQIPNKEERRFYELEAYKERWSSRELYRQFNTSLYERLALSRNKKGVHLLSKKGHVIDAPEDAIKDPYVLEFLRLDENPHYSENDLEMAIIEKLQHFLLEMGKGFLFQARQYRITFDEKHFWVDLVFYNRLLKSFVLVDLKIGDVAHSDIGQMQMYVNYFDRHVKSKEENPTIGILLCKTKNDALVQMTLPKRNKTIFASRYQLYLPSKSDLKKQLQNVDGGRNGNL